MTRSIMSIRKISVAVALALLMALGGFALLQRTVRADQAGDGWTMSGDHVLTINSQDALSNPDDCWKYAKTIIFAGNVTSIPDNAFHSMSALTTLDLGTVETTGRDSFSYCKNLTTVKGDNLTTVGPYAFDVCSALVSVDISKVETINDSAFNYCSSLKSIDISSAKVIESNAFHGCKSLTSVTLGDDIVVVAPRTFYNCSSLETVALGKSTVTIGNNAFENCKALKNIDLSKVEYIAEFAFYNCIALEDVDISNAESIGPYSFYACEEMGSVKLGFKMSYIPEYAFSKCLSLKSIDLRYISSLSQNCFSGCTSLETINLYNIDVIPSYAFFDCISLKEIDLSNARYVYENAFRNCEALETVTLGDRITTINKYSFGECDALKNINLGKVKTIEEDAFICCYALAEVDLSSVESVGCDAFYNCDLKEVDLPKAKTISDYAFYYCQKLEKVSLTNKLKSLAGNAFTDTALSDLYFLGSARQFEALDENWIYRSMNIEITYGAFDVSFDIGGNIDTDNIQLVLDGDKAVVPLEPTAEGLVFTGWYTDNSYVNAYDFDTPVTKDIVIYAGWMKASDVTVSVFKGHTLSLEGDIGVNFYTVLPADLSQDAYMKFKVQGISNELTIPVSSALKVVRGNTTYSVFKCNVPAKNMSSVITATLIDSGNVVDTDTYSVQQYAQYILEHKDQYSNAVDLVKDMINYGAYAQIYFNYNLDNLANNILDESDRYLKTAMYYNNPYDPDECVLPEGMTFSAVSLSLESNTVLKIFLTDTVTRDVKYYCNGVELTPEEDNGRTLIKIENIAAHELDNDYVINIVVAGDNGEYKVTYSATNYCFYVIAGETTSVRTQELKDLMLALHNYNESAKSYKGVENW